VHGTPLRARASPGQGPPGYPENAPRMDKNNPMQWTMVANCAGGTWERGPPHQRQPDPGASRCLEEDMITLFLQGVYWSISSTLVHAVVTSRALARSLCNSTLRALRGFA
jgi:hypothetical protein